MKFSLKFISCFAAPALALTHPFDIRAAANTASVAESATYSAAYVKAQALMNEAEFKAAIKVLKSEIKTGNDTFEINQLLVSAYEGRIDQVGMLKKRGLAIKIRETMEHALALNPNSDKARKALIEFHLKAPGIVGGDKDEARELVKGLQKLTPVEKHLYEAIIRRAETDLAGANSYLELALAKDPQNMTALNIKGNIQIEQKAYDDAITTFETCLNFHPNNVKCLYRIGKASHVGDVQTLKGIQSLERLVENYTGDAGLSARAHFRLGELYARSGDKAKAKKAFEQAVAINGLKAAKSALEKLETQ